tara:strand:- start:1575 stop:1814 length:240 start_codon:yes stop_codon:yes gene_type:complete
MNERLLAHAMCEIVTMHPYGNPVSQAIHILLEGLANIRRDMPTERYSQAITAVLSGFGEAMSDITSAMKDAVAAVEEEE